MTMSTNEQFSVIIQCKHCNEKKAVQPPKEHDLAAIAEKDLNFVYMTEHNCYICPKCKGKYDRMIVEHGQAVKDFFE